MLRLYKKIITMELNKKNRNCRIATFELKVVLYIQETALSTHRPLPSVLPPLRHHDVSSLPSSLSLVVWCVVELT